MTKSATEPGDTAATSTAACATAAETSQDYAIRIQNLQHFFGEGELRKQVLFDNNLEVARGEIVIMTGPSGSGKTTLLTLIGTLRRVQEGSLEVLSRQLRGATDDDLIAMRRQMGFIFQNHNLFASLTAHQNVKMALELFQFSPDEMTSRITTILTRLGLGHRIHYKPGSLSGGQKQRVAVARGLVHGPQVVLADEPTAALDEKSGREVVTYFQELAREHRCTIVMVTHDNRILDIADRIVNMVDGRIKSNVLVNESAVICAFLKQCPLFASLTPQTLTRVADQMSCRKYRAGELIIRQGESGDQFYLIRTGKVDVLAARRESAQEIATLGPGDYFGEAALLTGEPRNATIRALEDSELLTLGKDEFRAVIDASASLEEELRKALFERQ